MRKRLPVQSMFALFPRPFLRPVPFRSSIPTSGEQRARDFSGTCLLQSSKHGHAKRFPAIRRPNLKQQADAEYAPSSRASGPVSQRSEAFESLHKFRSVLASSDMRSILACYESSIKENQELLRPTDSLRLVTVITSHCMTSPRFQLKKMEQHVRRLAALYMERKLPSHPGASTQLLAIFKQLNDYEQGMVLWNWLEKQDIDCTDLGTYGSAIDFLSSAGSDITLCEDVYAKALDVHSNTFNRYLLSPNSVLPHPDRLVTTGGTSLGLLSGITAARFLTGDWRGAYLAVDTAFRVHPHHVQPHLLALVARFRPLEEQLRVFSLFIVAGAKINKNSVAKLLSHLQKCILSDVNAQDDRSAFVQRAVMAQLSVLRCVAMTSREILPEALSIIFSSMLASFPSNHKALKPEAQSMFQNLAIALHNRFAEVAVELDGDTEVAKSILMASAVKRGDALLTKNVLDQIAEFLKPQSLQLRKAIRLVLRSGDPDLILHAFTTLAKVQGGIPSSVLMENFIAHMHNADEEAPLLEVLQSLEFDPVLLSEIRLRIQGRAANLPRHSSEAAQSPQSEASYEEEALQRQETRILTLIDQLKEISAILESPRYFNPGSDTSWRPTLSKTICDFPNEWHKKLYHEMHIAPLKRSGQQLSAGASQHSVLSGIPLEDFRLESFKAINDLLILAQSHDILLTGNKDKSESSKTTSPGESPSMVIEKLEMSAVEILPNTEAEWRRRVLLLRGVDHSNYPTATN